MTLATLPPSTRTETQARLDTLRWDTDDNAATSYLILSGLAKTHKISSARVVADAAGIVVSIQERGQ